MATASFTTIAAETTSKLPADNEHNTDDVVEFHQPLLTNDMHGIDLMTKPLSKFDESPSPISRPNGLCELNLNCNVTQHGHDLASIGVVEDIRNANLPESSRSAGMRMSTHGCNGNQPADDVESLSFDGLIRRRRSSNWIVNNLASSTATDGVSKIEAAGTCSGVVWVETVEPHAARLDDLLVNSNSGHDCDRIAATNLSKRGSCKSHRPSNVPRTYDDVDNSTRRVSRMTTTGVHGSKSLDGGVLSFLRCGNDAKHANATSVLEEPIHMTLEEVRFSLNGVESAHKNRHHDQQRPRSSHQLTSSSVEDDCSCRKLQDKLVRRRSVRNDRLIPSCTSSSVDQLVVAAAAHHKKLSSDVRCLLPKSLKHTLCHWLGLGKAGVVTPIVAAAGDSSSDASSSTEDCSTVAVQRVVDVVTLTEHACAPDFVNRALPPLPLTSRHVRLQDDSSTDEDHDYSDAEDRVDTALPWWNRISAKSTTDFASSIQKVKDYGWYWGPISGQAAEAILADEPDGSFIVRDSSDEHYIFSLTFKLDGLVRHVRIEHDHGNFSFGTFTKFKSNTIVEFVENAVQHSRSGRYLFFLHRRPVLGPMRVQLLHPVSRFKQVQSLQHTCRFVILKVVRRDLIDCLPLPNRLKGYLNTLQYYSERDDDESTQSSRDDSGGSGAEINSHNSNPVTH